MIRVEDLVAGSPPCVSEIKKTLPPLVTDDQIIKVTIAKIERAKRAAETRNRWGVGPTQDILFSAYAGQKYSNLTPIDNDVDIRPAIGRAESARFRAVVFRLMQEYGLDERLVILDPSMTYGRYEQGTAVERLSFPSRTIHGLLFTQSRSYRQQAPDESIGFTWRVSDGLGIAMIGKRDWYLPEVRKALQLFTL